MFKTEMMQDIRDIESRTIIDVREKDEFLSCHIPHALNLPMSHIAGELDQLSKEIEYTVICQSGARSKQVAQFLDKQGFKVVNVLGGMGNYKGRVIR